MTVKPLTSTTKYIRGREREILHNAIYDEGEYICTISSPYRNKLKLLTETIIQTLENDIQGKIRPEATEPSTLG